MYIYIHCYFLYNWLYGCILPHTMYLMLRVHRANAPARTDVKHWCIKITVKYKSYLMSCFKKLNIVFAHSAMNWSTCSTVTMEPGVTETAPRSSQFIHNYGNPIPRNLTITVKLDAILKSTQVRYTVHT